MAFITDYLFLIIRSKDYYKDKNTLLLIERLTDSRLAILDGSGHCELVGKGWQEDNGIYYSNSAYKLYKPLKASKSSNSALFKKWDEYSADPYYDAYQRLIDAAWDENKGLYQFDRNNCPAVFDGDDSFCEVCEHYPECFAPTKIKEDFD